MTSHGRDRDAQFRIIGEPATQLAPTLGQFIRECYDWWRDGCSCTACMVVNSVEAGESSESTFGFRMQLLYDQAQGRHADGVYLPRMQLQLFANRA